MQHAACSMLVMYDYHMLQPQPPLNSAYSINYYMWLSGAMLGELLLVQPYSVSGFVQAIERSR